MYLFTIAGDRIMDLISGIGVSTLGHCDPQVVKAVQDQVEKYMHTMVYGEFVLSPQVLLAQILAEHLPTPLESVYFVNSGTEAVEGALKLAKKVTGRFELIACKNAYHGSTHGAMSLMSAETYTMPFRPLLPAVRFIEYNNLVDLDSITTQTAAVIVETVQAESGLIVPAPGYLKHLAMRCREVGALLILDEIQCALGRTGYLWAFQQYDIVPDILLLAKALGGGMPIGAFISSKEHMQRLAVDPALGHITTFGGHPVNCAAALAAFQSLMFQNLIAQVPQKSKLFLRLLPHPRIKEIRHCGLWFALDLGDSDLLHRAVDLALAKGLLIDWFLFNDRSLRLAPPLIISIDEIELACARIHEVLDAL
jgi:acetylornithine/succinyldiaminopimelate/putrescine aminotransferase